MRKNSTLPTIREPFSLSINKDKDNFKKISDKVSSHEAEIVKN
jgi:hypothetical protein